MPSDRGCESDLNIMFSNRLRRLDLMTRRNPQVSYHAIAHIKTAPQSICFRPLHRRHFSQALFPAGKNGHFSQLGGQLGKIQAPFSFFQALWVTAAGKRHPKNFFPSCLWVWPYPANVHIMRSAASERAASTRGGRRTVKRPQNKPSSPAICYDCMEVWLL